MLKKMLRTGFEFFDEEKFREGLNASVSIQMKR